MNHYDDIPPEIVGMILEQRMAEMNRRKALDKKRAIWDANHPSIEIAKRRKKNKLARANRRRNRT